jgi:outer membrane protein OmpA-like peptidoglycan-associated protein
MRALAWSIALLVVAGCTGISSTGPGPSSFLVFFPANSVELTKEAATSLDQAAAAIKNSRPASVVVGAGTGKGSSLKLAEPRFAAVQHGLEARGVPPKLIARASLPQTEAKTGEVGNQRVEIILGGH